MLITTKLAAFGSINFPSIFAKRSWLFWAQELENVWLFRHCTKSQTFSNSCAQNRHDLLAKIVGEVDGTKCGELCCYKHWTLGSVPYLKLEYKSSEWQDLYKMTLVMHVSISAEIASSSHWLFLQPLWDYVSYYELDYYSTVKNLGPLRMSL